MYLVNRTAADGVVGLVLEQVFPGEVEEIGWVRLAETRSDSGVGFGVTLQQGFAGVIALLEMNAGGGDAGKESLEPPAAVAMPQFAGHGFEFGMGRADGGDELRQRAVNGADLAGHTLVDDGDDLRRAGLREDMVYAVHPEQMIRVRTLRQRLLVERARLLQYLLPIQLSPICPHPWPLSHAAGEGRDFTPGPSP